MQLLQCTDCGTLRLFEPGSACRCGDGGGAPATLEPTLEQHISDLEKSSKQWEQSSEVWRKRVEAAADALADVLPGEVGRLDLLARISALKDAVAAARQMLARLKPSGPVCNRCCVRPAAYEAVLRTVTWERLCEECFGQPDTDKGSYVPPDGRRLKLSGQVAEDELLVRAAVDASRMPGFDASEDGARSALSRLAAKAQGYEAAMTDFTRLANEAASGSLSPDLYQTNGGRGAAEAVAKTIAARTSEMMTAVADNAARQRIGQQMANACFNLAQRDHLRPDERQTLDELRRAWDGLGPHPGAALLEQHRTELEQARNDGLETAALSLLGECDSSGADTCDCDPCMFARDIRALKEAS